MTRVIQRGLALKQVWGGGGSQWWGLPQNPYWEPPAAMAFLELTCEYGRVFVTLSLLALSRILPFPHPILTFVAFGISGMPGEIDSHPQWSRCLWPPTVNWGASWGEWEEPLAAVNARVAPAVTVDAWHLLTAQWFDASWSADFCAEHRPLHWSCVNGVWSYCPHYQGRPLFRK